MNDLDFNICIREKKFKEIFVLKSKKYGLIKPADITAACIDQSINANIIGSFFDFIHLLIQNNSGVVLDTLVDDYHCKYLFNVCKNILKHKMTEEDFKEFSSRFIWENNILKYNNEYAGKCL